MRKLGLILSLLVVSWVIDTFAFDGRYGRTIWRQAQLQGYSIKYQVGRWLDKALS